MREMIKTNGRPLLFFLLVHRVLWAAFFWQLAPWGIGILLERQGYAYLTEENLADFVLHPWTAAFLLLLLLLWAAAASIEMAVLYEGMWAAAAGIRTGVWELVQGGVRRLRAAAGSGAVRLWAVFSLSFLVLNGYFLFRLARHFRLARFLMEEGMKNRMVLAAALLILGILAALFLRRAFAPFSPLFLGEPFSGGVKRSVRLMGSRGMAVAGGLAAVQLLAAALYGGVFLAAMTAAALLLRLGGAGEELLAMLLVISRYTDMFLILLAGSGCTLFSAGFLTWQYLKSQRRMPVYGSCFFAAAAGRRQPWAGRVLSGALALLIFFFAADMIREIYRGSNEARQLFSDIRITAHRGVSNEAPENTMEALALAVESQADYVEIDVQETKDGVIVLLHDNSLARTCGDSRMIWEVTWQEVSRMDAGSWFSPEYAGARVPALEDVFREFGGQISMNIEVKNNGHNSDLVGKTIELIELYGMEDYVMISSSSYAYVKQVKESSGRIPAGLILSAAYGNFLDSPYVDFVSIRYNAVNRELIRQAHERGKEVHVWTVNTRGAVRRMEQMGADCIITDIPLLAREILYGEETLETIADVMNILLHER